MPRYLRCGLAKTTIQAILCASLGLGIIGGQLGSVFAQTNFGTASSVGNAGNALAKVYANKSAGILPNGMVAITFPTQITVNDQVQILMPDYRILKLQSGSYRIENGQIYAPPLLLQSIGYPVSEEMLVASQTTQEAQAARAPQATALMRNNLQVEALEEAEVQEAPPSSSIQRKVLGFIPQVGTVFSYDNSDPTYGTLSSPVTENECQTKRPLPVIRLAGDIAFDSNQAIIKPTLLPELDRLTSQMLDQNQATFTITGHTDSRGSAQYNQRLSEKRANAIMQYLVDKGVPRNKIRASGAGESRPIASNDTEKGRKENRRVEIASSGGVVDSTNDCTHTERIGASDGKKPQTLLAVQKQPSRQPAPMPQFDYNAFWGADYAMQNTFIAGSTGFSSGPAAVALPAKTPTTAGPMFAPTTTSTAIMNQPYDSMSGTQNTENSLLNSFSGVGNTIADVPPVVWGVAAAVTAVLGYLVFANSN